VIVGAAGFEPATSCV